MSYGEAPRALDSYKVAIQDWDDTKVLTREPKRELYGVLAEEKGVELTDETFDEHWGTEPDVQVPIYLQCSSPEETAVWMKRKEELDPKYPVRLAPDGLDFSQWLYDEGVLQTIVSSGLLKWIVEDLKRVGYQLGHYFHIQQGRDTSRFREMGFLLPNGELFPAYAKPDRPVLWPTLFRLYVEKHTVDPHDMVNIGDSIADFETAAGNNIDFIGVTTGKTTEEDFRRAGAPYVVNRLGELVP